MVSVRPLCLGDDVRLHRDGTLCIAEERPDRHGTSKLSPARSAGDDHGSAGVRGRNRAAARSHPAMGGLGIDPAAAGDAAGKYQCRTARRVVAGTCGHSVVGSHSPASLIHPVDMVGPMKRQLAFGSWQLALSF